METQLETFRNISFATVGGLKDVLAKGAKLSVRGDEILEIRNRITVLQSPWERCLFTPKRGNDIIATIAETFWILNGRNDIKWLERYLPRASCFSDDGITWRAGYGPRLRNWQGVDQLREIQRLLQEELLTRRAVMSLFDPCSDYIKSKDIPCNNWLHWLNRDNKLHLNVGVRSNDIIWGFSGVNSFTWSVLQEMMALWTGAQIGELLFFASSFHLYKHHNEKARNMVANFEGIMCYDYNIPAAKITIPFKKLDAALKIWFDVEDRLQKTFNDPFNASSFLDDPFFCTTLSICRIFHGVNGGWPRERLAEELARLPVCDLTAATYEYYNRDQSQTRLQIPDKNIANFIQRYNERKN